MDNTTKIKYIKVLDKIYEVKDISFYDFSVTAAETELQMTDVPAQEIFDISDFKEFLVKLHNWHGNVVDFMEYVKNRKNDPVKMLDS